MLTNIPLIFLFILKIITYVISATLIGNMGWKYHGGPQGNQQSSVLGIKGEFSGGYPKGRGGASVVFFNESRNCFIIGGVSVSSGGANQDFWEYDIIGNRYRLLHGDDSTNAKPPTGCLTFPLQYNIESFCYFGAGFYNNAVIDEIRRTVLYFKWHGTIWSETGREYVSLVFEYDYITRDFRFRKGPDTSDPTPEWGNGNFGASNLPPSLRAAGLWVKSPKGTNVNNIYIFGGTSTGSNIFWRNIWEYDYVLNQWRDRWGDRSIDSVGIYADKGNYTETNIPPCTSRISTWKEDDDTYCFYGGITNYHSDEHGDVWCFKDSLSQWNWMFGTGVINDFVGTIQRVEDGSFSSLNHPGTLSSIYIDAYYGGVKDGYFVFFFGGSVGGDSVDNLWIWSSKIRQFKYVAGTLNLFNLPPDYDLGKIGIQNPGGRAYGEGVFEENTYRYYIMIGSTDSSATIYSDVWYYDFEACGHFELSSSICSSHGSCLTDRCDCENGYVGDQCEIHTCNGIMYTNISYVCSGNGVCADLDICQCSGLWNGTFCDNEIDDDQNKITVFLIQYGWIFLVVLGVVGLILIIVMLVVCVICSKKCKMTKSTDNLKKVLVKKEIEMDEKTPELKINKELYTVKYKDVKLIGELGRGGGGAVVFKAKWKGTFIAFKVFSIKAFQTSNVFSDFEKELSIMSSVSHPNVIRFLGCSLKRPRIGILMEFCKNGDLATYIQSNLGKLKFQQKLKIMSGIASGMVYLHGLKIIHRDLKPENILIDELLNPKIMDFGISKLLSGTRNSTKTRLVGTSKYMSPEVAIGKSYDNRCVSIYLNINNYHVKDIYSFAIMCFELLSENFHPFGKDISLNIEVNVAMDKNFRPNIKKENQKNFPDWLERMITYSWSSIPDERPSFEKILEILERNIK